MSRPRLRGVYKLRYQEALAAANVIFPVLLRENWDNWKTTLKEKRDNPDEMDQDIMYDLTHEYLDLVNHLIQGVDPEFAPYFEPAEPVPQLPDDRPDPERPD